MRSLLTASKYEIPTQHLRWLNDEINKLSKRAFFHRGESFVLHSLKTVGSTTNVALRYWEPEKPGYSKAARLLCKSAEKGERVVVKLPKIPKSKSEYVGAPGSKLSLDVELYGVFQHNGFYGLTYIHKIRDIDGNELVWFSTGKKVEEGVYHMKAKVHLNKAHTEFLNTKQTRITHCKFEARKVV